MRIVARHTLIAAGPFAQSRAWTDILQEIEAAVVLAEWPPQGQPGHVPGRFTIHPQSGKKSGEGNGVVPIKIRPMAALVQAGWSVEHPWDVGQRSESDPFTEQAVAEIEQPDARPSRRGSKPGDIDAAKIFPEGLVVVEWETGNVSSSHRSLNKMALGLVQGRCIAGVLVVPNYELARYLTDRIGNVEELRSYFPMYQSLVVQDGVLVILVIQQDDESLSVPKIPKGRDGRAMEGANALRGSAGDAAV